MAERSRSGTGLRIEMHRPATPGKHPAKLRGLALTPSTDIPGSSAQACDITVTDSEGNERSLTYLLAQMFLPSSGAGHLQP